MSHSFVRRAAALLTLLGGVTIFCSQAQAQTADLSLTMTADRLRAKIGEYVVLRLVVTNAGPSEASNIELNVNLDDRLDGVCFVCNGQYPGGSFCNVSSLPQGGAFEGIYIIKAGSTFEGPKGRLASVRAGVSSATTDPNGANNNVELFITITGPKE